MPGHRGVQVRGLGVVRVAALPPAAIAWHTNLTHRQLADLFGVGLATVHGVIDRTTAACSTNYRRSVNFQVTVRARDRRIVVVDDDWPGNRNDIIVYRATMADQVAGHRLLIGGAHTGPHPTSSPARPRASRSPSGEPELSTPSPV